MSRKVITVKEYNELSRTILSNAGEVQDNRFAVVACHLFTVVSYLHNDNGHDYHIVDVSPVGGVNNENDVIEYNVCEDDPAFVGQMWLCETEQDANALFVELIQARLTAQFTYTSPRVRQNWSMCPLADLVDGLAHVEVHPVDGDSWSSDNARAKFSVNRAEGTYMQLSGEPLTLTEEEVKELLSVAEQAQ